MEKKKVEEFIDEFQYPCVILYGLEDAFLGVAELWNGHKLLLYDKEMVYLIYSKEGFPTDVIEKKFNNFFSFWKSLQDTPGSVFSGQTEETIKKHLPALVTRIKEGVNPVLENVTIKENTGELKKINLKEILENDERDSRNEIESLRDIVLDE